MEKGSGKVVIIDFVFEVLLHCSSIFLVCCAGDIPAATAEDVNAAVEAARRALVRNGGKDWSGASGAYRAKFLRAIAAKVDL